MDALTDPRPTAGRCRATTDCEHCRVRFLSVCAALERDELIELEAIAQPVHFHAKETIFLEGEDALALYNVTCGTLRLYRLFDDGRRQIVGFALPGDFLGLDLASRHAFSADAVEAVSACRLARTSFTALTERKPHLLRRLHAATTRELSAAQDQVMALGRRSAEEKLAWFLIHLRQRYERVGDHSATIALPMSRLDIADFLGLTIETVSRTLTKLSRDESIAIVADGIRVVDTRRIEQLAAA
jgi:CRP/FNR family transcriptional regulator, anaerobic regulatory protein